MAKTTNTTSIKDVIKEIKEYQAMQDELKKQINELKEEAIEWLDENELDEILTDEGKTLIHSKLWNREVNDLTTIQ